MLAHSSNNFIPSGALNKEVHLPATFLHELLAFIAEQLPVWRDDPHRRAETSETALTEQLCDFLSSMARLSSGWDVLQFRTEIMDEAQKGRKIDLAAKPCGAVLWIEGRCYTQYDALFPIECKRLPTPKDGNRDEREYVISQNSTTGGIQRFKAGHHGASHGFGAMIAYVQEDMLAVWCEKIAEWISDLVTQKQTGWSQNDLLHLEREDNATQLAVLRSSHERENNLAKIELRHLWIKMN